MVFILKVSLFFKFSCVYKAGCGKMNCKKSVTKMIMQSFKSEWKLNVLSTHLRMKKKLFWNFIAYLINQLLKNLYWRDRPRAVLSKQ